MSYNPNPYNERVTGNQGQSMLSVIYRRKRFEQSPSWELYRIFNRADVNDEREYQLALRGIDSHHQEGITEYIVADSAKYFIGYPAGNAHSASHMSAPEFTCSCGCSEWGHGDDECEGPDHKMITKYFYNHDALIKQSKI